MMCRVCGYSSDKDEWIDDYYFDIEEDDEIPIYKCPKCGNGDQTTLIDEWGNPIE